MFPFFNHLVQVGLHPQPTPSEERDKAPLLKQQGFVHLRQVSDGEVRCYGLVVDKPKKLIKPRPETIKDMFQQFVKLGFYPLNLEIQVDGVRRVYHYGKETPVLQQRLN